MLRARHLIERLPLLAHRRGLAFSVAFMLSMLALWLRWQLDPVFPPGFPFLTFFPAVIVSSFLFGRGPGVFAALLCGIASWYFFIEPVRTFTFNGRTAGPILFYAAVCTVDIALIGLMQRANARLAAERERSRELANRTELLFKELQHRVSNNLQMVGAMLRLHGRKVRDPEARDGLDDAARKLQLIGRIQRQLYDTSGAPLALDIFLAELLADLVVAAGKPGVHHRLAAEPGIVLAPNSAIPLALIMAEGVANAIEHGFAAREQGLIHVAVERVAGHIALSVTDDGRGLPDGFDAATATSLGLTVARTLAGQIAAELTIEPAPGGGTQMRLVIPDQFTLSGGTTGSGSGATGTPSSSSDVTSAGLA